MDQPAGRLMEDMSRDEAFERDKIAFVANVDQFRDLRVQFWQMPMWGLTLTGALWYASAAAGVTPALRISFHLLSAALDLTLMVILYRVRTVMSSNMAHIKAFNPGAYVHAPSTNALNSGHSLLIGLCATLGIAALCSLLAVFGLR